MDTALKSNGQNISSLVTSNQPGMADLTPEFRQKNLYNILEDMRADQKDLENQRVAIFNILTDVSETQSELKRSYQELEVVQNLTKELGFSVELRTVMENIVKAIHQLFPGIIITYIVAPFESTVVSNIIYIHAKAKIGEKYLNTIKENILHGLETLPTLGSSSKDEVSEWLKARFYFEMVEGEKDPQSQDIPKSQINIPIVVPYVMDGIINLSSIDQETFDQRDLDVIHAITNSAVQTVGRIKALIAAEHSRLGDLVKSMSNAVLMFDANRQIVVANPQMKRIVPLKDKRFTLTDFFKIFEKVELKKNKSQNEKLDISAVIDEALKNVKTVHIEELQLNKQFFELFITPVRDHERKVSGGAIILHDVTHRAEIDRMKTEFLSIAAHQLRTPLGSMRWNMEMLLAGDFGSISVPVLTIIYQIYESNQRMTTLVNELLNVSRIEQGRVRDKPQLTDIIEIVQTAVKEMTPEAKRKLVDINFHAPKKNIPKITIDPKRFREVIQNLLSNAVRYNRLEGKVTVKIERGDNHLKIKIADTGMGIPQKDQSRLFSKFFRSENAIKKETDGTGLGLFVVKSYVEGWGGKVDFESREGKGTTFTISLPLEPKQHVLDKNLEEKPRV